MHRPSPRVPSASRHLAALAATAAAAMLLGGCSGESDANADAANDASGTVTDPVIENAGTASGDDTGAGILASDRPEVPATPDDAPEEDAIPTSRVALEVYAITIDPASQDAANARALAAELGDFLGGANENVLSAGDTEAIHELIGALATAGVATELVREQIDAPLGIAAERTLATADALGTDLTFQLTPTASSADEPGAVRVTYIMLAERADHGLTSGLSNLDAGFVTSGARSAIAAPGETVYTAKSVGETGTDVLVLMTFE